MSWDCEKSPNVQELEKISHLYFREIYVKYNAPIDTQNAMENTIQACLQYSMSIQPLGKPMSPKIFPTVRVLQVLLIMLISSIFAMGVESEKPDIPKEFIRTEGTKFVDGEGNEFIIRAKGLWNGNPATAMRATDFNEGTYRKLASIGFNAVRFYFAADTFENVSSESVTYKEDAFEWLERHIAWAKKHHMKIVMNMHHSPGAATIHAPGLFTNPNQDRFVALWRTIAERYANEPTILGFDLINEAKCRILSGDTPENRFVGAFNLYQNLIQRTIDAIREVNNNHVIIVERLWISGVDEAALGVPTIGYYNTLPNDQRDTWQNVNGKFNFPDLVDHNYAYTYHVYEPSRFVFQYTGASDGRFDDDGSGGPNRVYPSDIVAKWDVIDPKTGRSWTMNKDFLEYAYTIPLDYIRNIKGVPAFVGELGVHVSNFENNAAGVNKGARQWILDTMEILDRHKLSFSYHSYRINEYHPIFNEHLESAFREAFQLFFYGE